MLSPTVCRAICSQDEYYNRLNAVWNPGGFHLWENVQPIVNHSLINSIAGYDGSAVTYDSFLSPAQTGQVSMRSSGDYILPDSSSRYLMESEIRVLLKEEMRLARNEVYARHGRKFDSEDLQVYFNSKPWYRGTIDPKNFNESVLNDYEIKNLDLIRAVEDN